jgi:toxin ParE1/3/4
MPIVVRSRQAASDLAEIARYIANDDPIAAHRWLDEMHELFGLISTQPEIGEELMTSRHGQIRRHTFRAYVIYYQAIPSGIEVLRVVHGARDHRGLI